MITAAGALLCFYVIRAAAMSRAEVLRSDYLSLDAAASIVRTGMGSRLYAADVQGPAYATLSGGDHAGDLFFNHAPLSAWLGVPFSLVNPVTGHALWGAFQLVLLVAAVVLVARCAPWSDLASATFRGGAVLLALAGAGTLSLLLEGQSLGEISLGLAASYWLWTRGRPGAGGALLTASAAIAKPHLAIGLVLFMIGWRDRRLLAGALTGATLAVAASVLAVGRQGVTGFVQAAMSSGSYSPATQQNGITGLVASLLGQGTLGAVVTAAGIACGCVACTVLGEVARRHRDRLGPALSCATVLSLLVAPHLMPHDLALLAPMFVAAVAAATRRGRHAPDWLAPPVRTLAGGWLILILAVGVDAAATLPVHLTPVALVVCACSLGPSALRGSAGRTEAGAAAAIA